MFFIAVHSLDTVPCSVLVLIYVLGNLNSIQLISADAGLQLLQRMTKAV